MLRYIVFTSLILFQYFALAHANDSQESLYISNIPVSFDKKRYDTFKTAETIKAKLVNVDPSLYLLLEKETTIKLLDSTQDSVVVSIPKRAIYQSTYDARDNNYKSSTFVLDYSEESIQSLILHEFPHTVLEDNPLDGITKFVDQWIYKKNYQRGFDIASVVANSREGDCTEHAVLLSAVSRALGFPSRVVFGTVIVGTKENPKAFGHAWNEVLIDGQWQHADAALYGFNKPVFYIPTQLLDNEGPGYSMSLMYLAMAIPGSVELL